MSFDTPTDCIATATGPMWPGRSRADAREQQAVRRDRDFLSLDGLNLLVELDEVPVGDAAKALEFVTTWQAELRKYRETY